VFTGAQAQALGLVDQLGDEEAARRLAAELAGLDPEKCRLVTFGKPQRRLTGLLPGGQLLTALVEAVQIELAWTGQPLWLYRP
jgi:protease-4